ncbi:MAG: hypothetical protein Q9174_004031 [Haloplaca sp. 1 TL-2023]
MASQSNATAVVEAIRQTYMTATPVEVLINHVWPMALIQVGSMALCFRASFSFVGLSTMWSVLLVLASFAKGAYRQHHERVTGEPRALMSSIVLLTEQRKVLEKIFLGHLSICVLTPNLPLRQIPLGFQLVADTWAQDLFWMSEASYQWWGVTITRTIESISIFSNLVLALENTWFLKEVYRQRSQRSVITVHHNGRVIKILRTAAMTPEIQKALDQGIFRRMHRLNASNAEDVRANKTRAITIDLSH